MEPRIQEELDSIENLKESRYLTRSELMDMINFPKNSPNLICIKSNDKGIGFLKGEGVYDSKFLAGVIKKDDFDDIINRASTLMGQVYSKKRKMDSQGVPTWYKLALLLAIITAFPFLIMAYYLPEEDLWFEILTFTLLAVSLIIVSMVSVVNFCHKTDDIKTFEVMIMERVGIFFERLNEDEYKQKGMEWYLVPGHYWLELRIHKRRNNFVDEVDHNQIFTTPHESIENRPSNNGGKGSSKREELKTEEPFGKDHSEIGNLDKLQN
mmetsp:Transcript_17194/g.15201  ORF Transcript_17194/g.15201 Transcript_17194/m.15201 type:complete len:267 (-) Transcript_17194:37-837(-)